VTIDTRTTILYDYSYIESAVVKLGEDTLEVASFRQYFADSAANGDMPLDLAGHLVTHKQLTENTNIFEINLTKNATITLKTFEDLVSVKRLAIIPCVKFIFH